MGVPPPVNTIYRQCILGLSVCFSVRYECIKMGSSAGGTSYPRQRPPIPRSHDRVLASLENAQFVWE